MVKPEDPGIPLGESQAERDALNKVKLNKFGVVPAKVAPYAAFSGGGNFTLKTGGSTVTAGVDGMVDDLGAVLCIGGIDYESLNPSSERKAALSHLTA